MAKSTRKKGKRKSVMDTDIRDLEVTQTLRKLGKVRVTEWEISDILPKVKEIAATEVDVLDFFKRTANLRVNDWELGSLVGNETEKPVSHRPPTEQEALACIRKLSGFLEFVAQSLIESDGKPTIKVCTPSPSEIRFRLVLSARDTLALIGHGGHTAAALRNLLKDAGTRSRFHVDLKILNHEEEKNLQKTQPSRAPWRNISLTN